MHLQYCLDDTALEAYRNGTKFQRVLLLYLTERGLGWLAAHAGW